MPQKLIRLALFSVALLLAFGHSDAEAQSMKMNVFIASSEPSKPSDSLKAATAHCYQLGYTMGASDQDWRAYLRVDGETPEVDGGPWFNYSGDQVAESLDELLKEDADLSALENDRGQADPDLVPTGDLDTAGTTGHFICYAHPFG